MKKVLAALFLVLFNAQSSLALAPHAACLGLRESRGEQQYPDRPITSFKKFTFVTYNLLNLFSSVGKYIPHPDDPGAQMIRITDAKPKEDSQRIGQARAVHELDADMLFGQEIESDTALGDFSEFYLGNRYTSDVTQGNDERGIKVGVGLKRELPLELEIRSNADEMWQDPTQNYQSVKLFSRDLVVFIARARAKDGSMKVAFIAIEDHGKSKRDRPGDPQSRLMADEQFKRKREIVERTMAEFPGVPIVFAGDTNRDFRRDPEPQHLLRGGLLVNSLDLAVNPLPVDQRTTHTFHQGNTTEQSQMDVILVNEAMKPFVSDAGIYRYKDADGREKPVPQSYRERERNPSDHFPVWMQIDFQKLLAARGII